MSGGGSSSWLIYALGGGLGHISRALALARVAATNGVGVTVLTNSPFAERVLPLAQDERARGIFVETIPSALGRDATVGRVHQALREHEHDVLVVDTFPRGLGGELAQLASRRLKPTVLVHRDISPAYVRALDLKSFVRHAYDLVLLPGERGPLSEHPGAVHTAPWLSRDAAELWSRADALERLAAPSDRPVVLVVAAGRSSEVGEMAELAQRLRQQLGRRATVRLATLASEPFPRQSAPVVRHWPVLDLLGGVDRVVGAGGYNTVYECRATARPLLALARPRTYDRQRRRLRADELVRDGEELLRRVEHGLAELPETPLRYENGAHRAVAAIRELPSSG